MRTVVLFLLALLSGGGILHGSCAVAGENNLVLSSPPPSKVAPSSLLSFSTSSSASSSSSSSSLLCLLQRTRGGSATTTAKKPKKNKKTTTRRPTKKTTTLDKDDDDEEEEEEEDSDAMEGIPTTRTTTSSSSTRDGKRAVNQAMKEDAATSLGDAIRAHAKVLQTDVFPPHVRHPLQHSQHRLESSLSSLGRGLATSSNVESTTTTRRTRRQLLTDYFVQTHGGVYAFQCLASLLAWACAMFVVSVSGSLDAAVEWRLMRRAWLFGMIRHGGGLLGAASVSATALQTGGGGNWHWIQPRLVQWAHHPVARQLFACTFWYGWTGILSSPDTATTTTTLPKPIRTLLLAPLLLRETLSNLGVLRQVVTILATGQSPRPRPRSDKNGMGNRALALTCRGLESLAFLWLVRETASSGYRHLVGAPPPNSTLGTCALQLVLVKVYLDYLLEKGEKDTQEKRQEKAR